MANNDKDKSAGIGLTISGAILMALALVCLGFAIWGEMKGLYAGFVILGIIGGVLLSIGVPALK
jgi:hypothetical protein